MSSPSCSCHNCFMFSSFEFQYPLRPCLVTCSPKLFWPRYSPPLPSSSSSSYRNLICALSSSASLPLSPARFCLARFAFAFASSCAASISSLDNNA